MKIYKPEPEAVYQGCYEWMGIISSTEDVKLSKRGAEQLFRLLKDVIVILVDNDLVDEIKFGRATYEDYIRG